MTRTTDANIRADWHRRCALAALATAALLATAPAALLTATRTGEFRVERREIGGGVHVWAIDGTPADGAAATLPLSFGEEIAAIPG